MIRYSAIAMITASSLAAQLANEAEEEAVEEDVVQLNPFEVSASPIILYYPNQFFKKWKNKQCENNC